MSQRVFNTDLDNISAAKFHSGVPRSIGLNAIAIDTSNAQPSELPYGIYFLLLLLQSKRETQSVL